MNLGYLELISHMTYKNNNLNLEDIIKGCKKGSKAHQKELYCLYSKILFNLSLKYCTSFSEAEDNLHDSFIEIFSKIDNFKHTGTFEGCVNS
jgi:DNA-directed RNA polymerase specialized sigma24 family protein